MASITRAICRARRARHRRERDLTPPPPIHLYSIWGSSSPRSTPAPLAAGTLFGRLRLGRRSCASRMCDAFTRGPLLEAPNCLRPFPGAQRRFEARRVKPWRPAVFPRSQKDDRPTRGRERAVGIQAPVALLSAPCMDSGRGRGLVSGDPPRGNDQGNEEAVVRGGQETSKATRVLKQVCSRAWS